MATFGDTLMCEQLGPKELVEYGVQAERAGNEELKPRLEKAGLTARRPEVASRAPGRRSR